MPGENTYLQFLPWLELTRFSSLLCAINPKLLFPIYSLASRIVICPKLQLSADLFFQLSAYFLFFINVTKRSIIWSLSCYICNVHLIMCPKFIVQGVFISWYWSRCRISQSWQNIFALFIIYPIICSSQSHFVQPTGVCLRPVVSVVSTFCICLLLFSWGLWSWGGGYQDSDNLLTGSEGGGYLESEWPNLKKQIVP